jgi:3-methylcrotonyl-CoA carboxylase alpha subunit
MGEAACAAARAIGYVGAGTVEFIAEGDAFYFMEMNTRLQVEHPVTEAITGQDLVEWQLRVAAGEPLPLTQEQLSITGHAIEVRIYAEDPARDFLPSIGTLAHLRAPDYSQNVRVDTGVREGDTISVHYDPMIAKLIVRDRDRPAAVRRLRRALAAYEIVGVTTNIGFLSAIAAHPAFAAAELDTGFIGRHGADLFPAPRSAAPEILAAAALRVLRDRQAAVEAAAARSNDPWSPWNLATAWRMNGDGYQDLVFRDGEAEINLRAHPRRDGGCVLDLPDGPVELGRVADQDGVLGFTLAGVKIGARVVRRGDELTIIRDGVNHRLVLIDPLAPSRTEAAGGGKLTAPMPGRITQVLTEAGAEVARGAPLLVLEAMKMEHTIAAPADGTIEAVRYAVGDLVEEGAELIVFVQP